MKCIVCGQPIPPSSRFCLGCGAPITETSSGHTTSTLASHATQVVPGGSKRGAGPTKAVLSIAAAAAATLAIATAVIVKHSQGLATENTDVPHAVGLATAPSDPNSAAGLATAPTATTPPAGLATAPTQAAPPAGLATASTQPASPSGIGVAPSNPPPTEAKPQDDVMPYLKALQQIEIQRQQIDTVMLTSAMPASGGSGGGMEGMLGTMLGQGLTGMTDDSKGSDPGAFFRKLTGVFALVSKNYADLVQKVQALEVTPGVPASCKDLQGYYLHALSPYVSLSSALQADPDLFPKIISAQSEVTARIDEADHELNSVCSSHKIEPFFHIKEVEMGAGSGVPSGNIIGDRYKPGH